MGSILQHFLLNTSHSHGKSTTIFGLSLLQDGTLLGIVSQCVTFVRERCCTFAIFSSALAAHLLHSFRGIPYTHYTGRYRDTRYSTVNILVDTQIQDTVQ